jgi:SSS family solute:Na+ symporter
MSKMHWYPSDMAQNFWGAIWAWSACFVVTILISLVTAPRKPEELKGLVYSLTPRIDGGEQPWYKRPAVLATVVGVLTILLNVYFW